MRLLALALVALLSGCVDPTFPLAWDRERATPAPTPPAVVPPRYDLNVVVTRETPDGAPLAGAEVVAYVLGADGQPTGVGLPGSTTAAGVARFGFSSPTAVAVRAFVPGWTVEGVKAEVGAQLVADGAAVSGRDLFLPLYRAALPFTASLHLSTATVVPGDEPGTFRMPLATAPLDLPADAKSAYLARLSAADVTLRWEDTPTSRADLSAGLAWDQRLWVAGDGSGVVGLGPRSAGYSGELPADGRPADPAGARLSAAAVLESAVVGDVPIAWEVTLRFAGRAPPGLPAPCHSAGSVCPGLPPLPAVA
jgi:hypothetical protein